MLKILYSFLIITLFTYHKTLKCNQQEIEDCLECGTDENSDTCVKCPETHFLFYHNLKCIRCDDLFLGNVGCEKNCNADNFKKTEFIECAEDSCKEGYYNINGKCFPCSYGSPNCIKCEYKSIVDGGEKVFKCLKCKNETDFISLYDGRCHTCNDFITGEWPGFCEKCKYNNESKLTCQKCISSDYYIGKDEVCKKCTKKM